MPEVTTMKLGVDLECDRCYKKIKRLLCKFPEIRDQAFSEKDNIVMIKVVCCSPHKIREKLICKGGKTIKSIEIIVPEKPKPPPEKAKPPSDKKGKQIEPEKAKPEPEKAKPEPEKAKPPEKPKPPPEKLPEKAGPKQEKGKLTEPAKSKEPEKPKSADPPKHVEKPPAQAPVAGYPQFYPVAVCCKPCFDLGQGGPCHHVYSIPHQRPSSYDGYVKLVPSYDESCGGWSSGCRCNRSYGCRCEYFTEENPACTIM